MSDWHDWHDLIDLANERLNEAEALIKAFIDDDPYRIVEEFHRDEGSMDAVYIATITATKQIPRRISLLVAEILNHLRSSLDHVMYAVSVPGPNGEPPGGTQFPIFKDKADFKGLLKHGLPQRGSGLWQMRGAPMRVQALVQRRQPYKRGARAEGDSLWLLHALTNMAKHRKPHLTGSMVGGFHGTVVEERNLHIIGMYGSLGTAPFQAGAELGRIKVILEDPDDYSMKVEFNRTFDVAFDPKGPGRGVSVLYVMRVLINNVRFIVTELEPFVQE